MGRLRFELRTNRLKAECSTAELATHLIQSVELGADCAVKHQGKLSPGGTLVQGAASIELRTEIMDSLSSRSDD